MITQTKLNVTIDGKPLYGCLSLSLTQPIHGHHTFRAEFAGRAVETDPIGLAGDSIKLIGCEIQIGIANSRREQLFFRGLITAVYAVGANQAGYTQNIVFEGHSPTILLDNGPSCKAFTNMRLQDILHMAIVGVPENLMSLFIKPRHKKTLAYTVRYNESVFAFINRLARRFGEWFYYDGERMVFGERSQKTVELLYGHDLYQLDYGLKTAPIHHKFAAYGYKTNEVMRGETKASDSVLNGRAAHAMGISAKTWQPSPPVLLHEFDDESALRQQLDDVAKLSIQASAANKVVINGSSSHPGLFPGAYVNVKTVAPGGNREYGQYVVTAVSHQYTDGGKYLNSFEAVPFDVEVSPMAAPGAFPVSQTQSATVTHNNDPEGLGRVKVQFAWLRDTTTPWLRVAMPYTGADKGMFFVPEVGEEVIVGFENGNAEKPYVMGSFYHGKAKPESFKSDKNDIKAIRTRSGHTISMDDTDGKEMFTISDKGGSIIQFDAKEKSLYISSPENLEISAKNIKITAEGDIEVGAKGNVNLASKKDINALAEGALALQSKKDTTIKADGAATVEATKDATITGQNVTVEGKMKAEFTSGAQTTVTGKMTTLQGAAFKIDVT